MKKVVFLFACTIITILSGYAQEVSVKFDETVHDFGTISEKGGKATHDFTLTNTSNKALTISKVKASCGCTTPSWTTTPIEPGATGKVSVAYNPKGRPGKFNKSINVTLSEGAPIRLQIKGEVVKSEPTIQEKYPVAYGSLLFKQKDLEFGYMTPDGIKTSSIVVYNNSDAPLTPKFQGLPNYISVAAVTIPAKTEGKLDFTLNAKQLKRYGNTFGTFTTDSKNPFTYDVTVYDDFSKYTQAQKDKAGKINVSATELVFSKDAASAVLKISNSGKSDLEIKAIQSTNRNVELSKTSFKVKPKQIAEVKVKYPANKMNTKNASALISIYSDDPNSPIKEVKVTVK